MTPVLVNVPTEEPELSREIEKVWLGLMVPKLQPKTWLPTAPEMAHVPGPV